MHNKNRAIFLASFLTLIAAGAGFAIRGAILSDWETQFGFTKGELGTITGGGLTGFGIIIILASLFVDKVGYKSILLLAFVLHILSAAVTLAATPVFAASGKDATYWCLYVGMFLFAIANGLCEAAINPLVATLYPQKKTHYLNVLHAGWPGGLIIGGMLGFLFCGGNAVVMQLRWEIPMMFFLIPAAVYGFITLKEKFPLSEARAAGVGFGEMLTQFVAPIFLLLLVLHAMVGSVELGTDSWITNIMENVLTGKAVLVLVYTSAIMFVLRFFAGPIVERINPIGLLLASAILGCGGLYWLGSITSTNVAMIFLAATVYGIGKTFLWPTMLGVVGERYPRGGALTMGVMGGVGMLSAGLLGGPGIGYAQDYYASLSLKENAPKTHQRYVSSDKNSFLFFPAIAGLDGGKVGSLREKKQKNETLTAEEQQDYQPVVDAGLHGGRMALKCTAAIPFAMAVGYLFLVIYFRMKGGYQVEVLHGESPDGEKYTGGVEGPVE